MWYFEDGGCGNGVFWIVFFLSVSFTRFLCLSLSLSLCFYFCKEIIFFCVREEPVVFLRLADDFAPYTPRRKENLHENLHGLDKELSAEALEVTIRKEVSWREMVMATESPVKNGRKKRVFFIVLLKGVSKTNVPIPIENSLLSHYWRRDLI